MRLAKEKPSNDAADENPH